MQTENEMGGGYTSRSGPQVLKIRFHGRRDPRFIHAIGDVYKRAAGDGGRKEISHLAVQGQVG